MIEKEKLKEYANRLMFDMSEDEYKTLQDEFAIILKQMELIGKIDGIEKVDPMHFPFVNGTAQCRKDNGISCLDVEEVISNTKHEIKNQIKVPKVVE